MPGSATVNYRSRGKVQLSAARVIVGDSEQQAGLQVVVFPRSGPLGNAASSADSLYNKCLILLNEKLKSLN